MSTINRTKRANGSGTTATWNPTRARWEIRVSLPLGKRTTVRGTTAREAEQKREQLLGLLDQGVTPTPERYTVGHLLDEWHAGLSVEKSVKRGTLISYESHIRLHLKPTLGTISLKLLTPADVKLKLIQAKLNAGSSPRMVQMMRDTLRVALNYAVSMDMVTRNVAAVRIKINVPDNSRVGKALTYDQALALLETSAAQRNGPLFQFLMLTGMRLGEALALHWSDVDLAKGIVSVDKTLQQRKGRHDPDQPWSLDTPKTQRSIRTVPLVAEALEALRTQHTRQAFERNRAGDLWHTELGFVFTNEVGEPLSDRGVLNAWKRALAHANVDTTHRIHDLRHTAVSYLIKIGTPLPMVQAIVGHTTLAMTARYAHFSDDMFDDVRSRMDALWITIREQHASGQS